MSSPDPAPISVKRDAMSESELIELMQSSLALAKNRLLRTRRSNNPVLTAFAPGGASRALDLIEWPKVSWRALAQRLIERTQAFCVMLVYDSSIVLDASGRKVELVVVYARHVHLGTRVKAAVFERGAGGAIGFPGGINNEAWAARVVQPVLDALRLIDPVVQSNVGVRSRRR